MLRIGTSGWRYPEWRGVFYPEGLRQADELEYAASYMGSVELNGSFYSLQRPEFFRRWYDATPRDFLFSVKGGRFITHMKKLRDVEVPLANFFASGVLALDAKLGPILWQFPERFGYDERFDRFFSMLPRDTIAAAELAKRHDDRLIGRAYTDVRTKRSLRYAVEVRSPSAFTREFLDLLRRHGIALVVADTAGRWPYVEDVTSDSCTSACTATASFTRAGTRRRPSAAGRNGFARGPPAWSHPTRVASATRRRHAAKDVTSTFTSTTT